MSRGTDGLKSALTAARRNNRELKAQNKMLLKLVERSNMSKFYDLLTSRNYFGGLYDRLGLASQLLTAIAWENYPDKSFGILLSETKEFCPEIAAMFDRYGIEFAVIAPGDRPPHLSESWQLETFGRLQQDFIELEYDKSKFRVYTMELFADIYESGNDKAFLIGELYTQHKAELDAAIDKFNGALLSEVETGLKADFGLSVEKLIKLCQVIYE